MDLLTHVVFAYLFSFVLWGPAAPQYIAAGALAGGLPDADGLLFPLARRFPILEHHGITHSIVGVSIIAGVGSLLLPFLPYFPHASTLLYFIAMELGGLSHVFLDGFTHFAVHPILPFSWRELRLDADVAINVVMLALTATTLVTLGLERGSVPFSLWVETAWILTTIYAAYLVIRAVARWKAGVVRTREGFTGVGPSTAPWVWTLIDREETPERYSIRYRRYRMGEKAPAPERRLVVDKRSGSSPPGPVRSPQEALDRSYEAAMNKNGWLALRPHFGEASARGGVYDVVWYMVEGTGSGRTWGVHGTVDADTGAMQLRSGIFQKPASGST
ncbi:MAG: metal-dependent hydrolase [Thermoplasmata archaeon]|nr:metal-dependent hydrolase [Thermoplasmata archaeon]